MKNYLKEYEDALNKIVAPVLEDDWEDDDGADDDDSAAGGFSQEAMFIQLGRIIDSEGNPKPVEAVTTDDGDRMPVSIGQAKILRMLGTTDKVKPSVRDRFLKDIQTSNGLGSFLRADPKEMPSIFVKRYLA